MDETRPQVLSGIDHWLNQWGHPVWEGIYLGDREACENILTEANHTLGGSFSTPDAESAAGIYLDFLRTQTQAQFSDTTDEQNQIRLAFIDKISPKPASGEMQTVMWARTLLTIRCLAHHLGIREINESEISSLIEYIPDGDLDHQSLSYLTFWAFHQRNKFYLDYTYRLFLTDPFVFMVKFSQQRIRVMRALVYGSCDESNIEKLIDYLPHKMHVEWFEDFIIPVCQTQKIWNQSLAQQLMGKSTGITLEGSKVPTTTRQISFQLNF